jgi:hypothetical protein
MSPRFPVPGGAGKLAVVNLGLRPEYGGGRRRHRGVVRGHKSASQHLHGGNSRHTRNVHYLHEGPDNFLIGSYEEEEFYQDLLRITGARPSRSSRG